jgi:gluconolactonase
VADLPWDAFHEAGVHNVATGKIYATSNWASEYDNPINITTIDLNNNDSIASLRYDNVRNANGGCAYYPPGTPLNSSEGQQIVFADQGHVRGHPSQLTLVDPLANSTRVLINNYRGHNFSSINDVVQHPITGDLYFTDARYAYW